MTTRLCAIMLNNLLDAPPLFQAIADSAVGNAKLLRPTTNAQRLAIMSNEVSSNGSCQRIFNAPPHCQLFLAIACYDKGAKSPSGDVFEVMGAADRINVSHLNLLDRYWVVRDEAVHHDSFGSFYFRPVFTI